MAATYRALPATPAIADAPDLTSNGTLTEIVSPWNNSSGTTYEGKTPSVWHSVFVPIAGTLAVTQNASPYGYSSSGDVFLSVAKGPVGGARASDTSMVTFVASDDDGDGNRGGKLNIAIGAADAGRWYYINHSPFTNGGAFSGYVYVTQPVDTSGGFVLPRMRVISGGAPVPTTGQLWPRGSRAR